MFAELQPLLANRSLVLIVSALKGDQIQVCFIPKATDKDEDKDKPLLQPLTITATAAELDSELPAALTDYADNYKTIAEQVTDGKKAMADAKAAQDEENKTKSNKKVATPQKKHVPPVSTKAVAKPEVKKEEKKDEPAEPSLFGSAELETFEG